MKIVSTVEIGDDEFHNEQIETRKDYQKNLLLLSKLYNEFYKNIVSVFGPMFKNLPIEERNEIQNELMNNGLGSLDFNTNLESSDFIDKFMQFYFDNGHFPGNVRMIILPKTTLPNEIENTKPIKVRVLFEGFHGREFNALVSFQATCALLNLFKR